LWGPALNNILQPGPAPFWAISLFIFGGIILVMGLLILIVPPYRWKAILNTPRSIRRFYWWKRYSPKYSFVPTVTREPVPGRTEYIEYFASVTVHIKNRTNRRIRFGYERVRLKVEQRWLGWDREVELNRRDTYTGSWVIEPGETINRLHKLVRRT